MQLANADALIWALALVAMIATLIGYWIWKQRLMRQLGDAQMIATMANERSARRQIAGAAMVIVGAALMTFALAQPQWGKTDHVIKRTGVDVVFALDLSRSMLARDASPSRLQAAKNEIATALEQLGGDRVGLVVFTAVSFAQSPLTSDYGAIRFYLRKLQPGQMPFGGTSIGRAVSDAVDLLTGASEEKQSRVEMKRAKKQIVVLITDGEDHESDPRAAARLARQHGVHVVTVGLGSTQGERIPVYRDDGSIAGYKRDRKGEIVYTRLDEETLRRLADETGGTYIHYDGENSVAYALVDYINQLEKTELEALMRQRYKEQFMWFLGAGLLLVLLGFALGDRRRPGARRVGQGGAPPKVRALIEASKAAVVLLALLSAWGCEDTFRDVVGPVAEGNRLVEEGDFEGAIAAYERAKQVVPPSPELHYDIGRAHMGAGDTERAQEFFARALETDDQDLRFDALYNLGLVLAAQERWRESYDAFRQALELYASQPPKAKLERYRDAAHNLEYVFQKLFPPCETLEDDREDDDEPGQASRLEELKVEGRTLCGLDDDWYAIPVLAGTQVAVAATFDELREEPDPEHVFLPRAEDLQIALFDATGERVLAIDQGLVAEGRQVEQVKGDGGTRSRVRRVIEKFTVTPDMLPGDAPVILLKVKAEDELEFEYDLDITAIPPCQAIDDEYEENDARADAAALEPGAHQLHICPGDEDFFRVNIEMGDTFFVDLQPGQDIEREQPPALALELLSPAGEVLATGRAEGGLVTAGAWELAEPGEYIVRVSGEGGDQQGPYDLELYHYAPCSLGDDRFEDNDDAQHAAALDPRAPMQRYLRLCPEDPDFFTMPLRDPDEGKKQGGDDQDEPRGDDQDAAPTPRKLALGLAVVTPPESSRLPEEERQLHFDLMSESGDQILLEGRRPVALEQGDDQSEEEVEGAAGEEEGTPIALDLILQRDDHPAASALVKVQGTQTFYHLVQLDPQSPDQQEQQQDQQQDQEQKGEDEQKQDQKQDQDQQKQDQSSGDPNDEQDSSPEGDEEKQDEGDQEQGGGRGEQEKKQDEPSPGEQEQPEDGSSEEQRSDPSEEPSEEAGDPQMRRIDDILRALEESDDNFQMRKALENTPGRYIEKDW